VEGFSDVPDSCGKYGWTYSNGVIQLVKDVFSPIGGDTAKYFVDHLTSKRLYTPSECKNVGGFYGDMSGVPTCFQLKNLADGLAPGNTTGEYNTICAGLNKQATSPPQECYINKQIVGKPNVEFTVTLDNTPLKIQSGTVLLYTEEECTKLGGFFINSAKIKTTTGLSTRDMIVKNFPTLNKLTELDVNNALSLNGYDMGMCSKGGDKEILNLICAAGNTTISKATDAVKNGANNAYNYIASIGS
jgi:hypothetical protein